MAGQAGRLIPWEIVPAVKVHELAKFHSEFEAGTAALYTTTFVLAMNRARYESPASDLKKVIDANSGSATSAWFGKTQQGLDPQGRKAAVDRGNPIHQFTAAQREEFVKLSSQLDDEWIADMDKRGFKGKAFFDAAKALIAKHGKG